MMRARARREAWGLLAALLGLACVASALVVVQVEHHSRQVTTQLSEQHHERDTLRAQYTQLRLEEATLSSHARLQRLAQSQFDMIEPRDYVIVVPQPPAAGGVR